MKKEWADKWAEALRSGKYKQGRCYLKSVTGGYCCLGVLCELAGAQQHLAKPGMAVYFFGSPGDTSFDFLPFSVCDLTGLRSVGGARVEGEALSWLNDNADYSFNQIADIIEKEWESL